MRQPATPAVNPSHAVPARTGQRWSRWRTLPREARDNLFLLAVIAWTVAPLAPHLPWWCSGMALLILLGRGWLTLKDRPLPGMPLRLTLLVLATGATLLTYRTLLGRDAGVTFIVVLLALKTLELRARRDAFVVFFLGFFTLLAQFFYSQSLLSAMAMFAGVWALLTAVVNSHMPAGRPSLWLAARTAARMALLGAPIMAVLFILFPRVAPLWGVPSDSSTGRTGLAGDMVVGNVARLAQDSSVAMRVAFEGDTPARELLYFRGPVLSQFDGRQWRQARSPSMLRTPGTLGVEVSGTPVRYSVVLEPNQQPWLPVLDATIDPPQLEGRPSLPTRELQWWVQRPVDAVVRYSAQSYPRFRYGQIARDAALQDYLELPAGFNPRTQAMAQQMLAENPRAEAMEMVALVLERLRTGDYLYTLEPGLYGEHTADEFWFDRKLGFCEHIASAFVVLMRGMGVPSRVVTGYQGGERNGLDGLWTVRQSDAHAWAEIWSAGQGWIRVDPTSAVAPLRTSELARLLPTPNLLTQTVGALPPGLLQTLREAWEATNSRWNQWVLNYSQGRQFDLLRALGVQSPSWQDLGLALAVIVSAVSLLGAAWAQWERLRQDPWLRLLGKARARIRRLGVPLGDHAPARTMAQALRNAWADDLTAVQPIVDWLLHLEHARYAAGSPHRLPTLRREYRALRWPAPRPSVPSVSTVAVRP